VLSRKLLNRPWPTDLDELRALRETCGLLEKLVRADKRQLSPRPAYERGNAKQQYMRALIRQSPELVQRVAP